MTLLNCDIGERGHGHAGDAKLMGLIHIANIACDGHAGDKESVAAFRALAERHGVRVSAHISYPDRKNFGRATMKIPEAELLVSLDAQLALLPDVQLVKFHGALYNDSWREAKLAGTLAQWLKRSGIPEIIAPPDSELAAAARKLDIIVLREAFIERRYEYDEKHKRLHLVARSKPHAAITDLDEALAQAEEITERRRVNVSHSPAALLVWKEIEADTICIHSDSPIALELAGKLRDMSCAGRNTTGPGKENYRLLRPGICENAGLPRCGRQDLGFSPGGAMDCFSLKRGNLLLGNPEGTPALEILVPPEIEILSPGSFILTGARRTALIQHGETQLEAEHSRVYPVEPGTRITFGDRQYGLLTYFCFRSRAEGCTGGVDRPLPFSEVNSWADPHGRIRVIPGPEFSYLEDPRPFFANAWRTTFKMDKMGIRLAGDTRLKCGLKNMVSEAVADGTVQLTPDSPIILLRHRQTTGGYPRIFNVITADMDLLGQYCPNQVIRFADVSLEEAREFARQKEEVLEKLRRQIDKRA